MKAAWEETSITIQGISDAVKLAPGQFICGRYSLHFDYHQGETNPQYSTNCRPSPLTLYRWLNLLAEMGILSIKTCNKYSVITILNWSKSQNAEHQAEHQTEHQAEHKEEGKRKRGETHPDAERLYLDYLREIRPKEKAKQRAIRNISSHLKRHSPAELRAAILNYQTVCRDREPMYRKNPANFFGKNEMPFLDYLPKAFEQNTLSSRPDSHSTSGHQQTREITPENVGALYEN